MNSDNLFDRLPDEIVREVFNKLKDAKSLCLSMSVCKRFYTIAPQVNEVFLSIPQKKPTQAPVEPDHGQPKNFFKNRAVKALIKPLHFISQMIRMKSKKNDLNSQSFYVPNEVIKSFEEIRSLHVKLPCHENPKQASKKGSTFLKWNAEFGKELQSCVIFGAKSVTENEEVNPQKCVETRVIGDEELKQRIVWTISCLIAASARHYLIQQTLASQKLVEDLVVSDESDQGRVCMNKEQIEDLRGFLNYGVKGYCSESSMLMEYRSRVPALRMKMWYLEKVELPDSGKVIEGATLVVIRPAGGGVEERSDSELVAEAFGGKVMVEEAVKKLMVAKKCCYTLEMNAF